MADPVLDNWRLIAGDETMLGILVGEVRGHPRLRTGWITTSAVAEIAPDRSWARTTSRRYTLGAALPDDRPLPSAAADAILSRLLRNAEKPLPIEDLRRLAALAETLSQASHKPTH